LELPPPGQEDNLGRARPLPTIEGVGRLRRFRAALAEVEDKVSTANAAHAFDYRYLLPSKIPASTNI
jgi:hypothetical protein